MRIASTRDIVVINAHGRIKLLVESDYTNDDDKWTAVLSRDPDANGVFVYAVDTTGVYCRPICPARRPKRDNTSFYRTSRDAGAAGFRACLRCRPDAAASPRHQIVERACRMIETSEEELSLERLAQMAGLSRFHFHRLFRAVTGVTAKSYAVAVRAERLRLELKGENSITDALYAAGYGSSSRCYAETDGRLGMSPGAFRDGGLAMTIRFSLGESSLGHVLVAATDKGVCAIRLGDDREALVREFEGDFPNATLVANDPGFARIVAAVLLLVDRPTDAPDLPLDIQGTVFQQRVWQALRAIPAGHTSSYAEVARAIGAPSAVRAVAGACAANRIALAIPCHRVVRTDGTMGGYRWGTERKRALLAQEAAKT